MVVIVQGGQEVTLPLFADHMYMPGAQSTRHVHKYSHLKSGTDTMTSQPPCNLVSLTRMKFIMLLELQRMKETMSDIDTVLVGVFLSVLIPVLQCCKIFNIKQY
jgi:hypothetical protein